MKCLTINEMLDLIHNDGDREIYDGFVTVMNGVAELIAAHIRRKHTVVSLPAATEEHELGGTAVYFGPINPEDPEPEAFKRFDQGQPWHEED